MLLSTTLRSSYRPSTLYRLQSAFSIAHRNIITIITIITIRTFAMAQDSKACLTLPPVVTTDYKPKGQYEDIAGFKTCRFKLAMSF